MGFPVVSRSGRKQRIKSFLPLRVRLRADVCTVWRAKMEQGLGEFPALSSLPNIENGEHNRRFPVCVRRQEWQGRSLTHYSPDVEILRRGINKFAIPCQHLLCLVEGEND